jgi:hypothetical protein
MGKRVTMWGGAIVAVCVFNAQNAALAQFNPYVMPRFNAAGTNAAASIAAQAAYTNAAPYDSLSQSVYNPYSYGVGPVGGAYIGIAEIYRAYGTAINDIERARILRQQSIQAKLDTQRKRFELEMYLRANTPTYTDEQARVARITLKRIQNSSTPTEIAAGKALNIMLEDARKFPNRKAALSPMALSEDILQQLNVTAGEYGLGVLRNEGRINWPLALQELLPAEQRKLFEAQAQALYQGAAKGKVDPNVFRDFSNELDRTYDGLLRRANEIPGPQYLEAKRYLSDLKDARNAIEKGEVANQVAYQKQISGGKSIADIVEFMIGKGLRFAPAAGTDEAAYRAFYAAFVNFDVALNAQGNPMSESKDNK